MRAIVIEDSRTQAAQLRAVLEREGFTVEVATDGESGVAACLAQPPDVVISDVLMPGIDGYEVCRRLRASPKTRDVAIMLLTSLNEPTDVVRALAAGADNFATKPFDEALLVARLWRTRLDHEAGADSASTVRFASESFKIDAPRSLVVSVLVSALEDAKLRNEELERGRAALARSNAERDALMGAVAHDLKTPLTTLVMRAQLAARKKGPERADELDSLSDIVVRQSKRMITIIDDLLDVARIETGALHIERVPTDLTALASEAVERLRPTAPAHDLTLEVGNALELAIDSARIEQVVTNLLTNAIKYSPAGGTITLAIREAPGRVRVEVSDHGIGIPPEARTRIFERYARTADGARTAEGLGLGLFICKQLVELHRGEIGVDSEPGKGSTFWFTLPR